MLVIAEIGTSHGGSIEKAKKLIDTAHEAGADGVKFQWVYAEEILHPKTGFVELPGGKIPLFDRFKELEVEPEFFYECKKYAHEKNLKFACSPFGIKSLNELFELGADFIKIASPELNHIPLLKELSRLQKKRKTDIIISSGVSKMSDIEKALDILGTENVFLLHCVTSYPAPEEQYNLRVIKTLSQKFNIETGVSDHSLSPVLVPALTCALGGKILEKHITLSKKTDGLDDKVALDGDGFFQMCHCIRQCEAIKKRYGEKEGFELIKKQLADEFSPERIEKVLGNGKKTLAPAEKENYGRTNRSIHFVHDMKKGETITRADVAVLRTEKLLSPGIHPENFEKIIGATLKKNVSAGEGVQKNDFT